MISSDVKNDVISSNSIEYEKNIMHQNVSVSNNHRRKKYSDLKSVHEKKKEMESNESFMRSLRPAEAFEF